MSGTLFHCFQGCSGQKPALRAFQVRLHRILRVQREARVRQAQRPVAPLRHRTRDVRARVQRPSNRSRKRPSQVRPKRRGSYRLNCHSCPQSHLSMLASYSSNVMPQPAYHARLFLCEGNQLDTNFDRASFRSFQVPRVPGADGRGLRRRRRRGDPRRGGVHGRVRAQRLAKGTRPLAGR